MGPLKPQTSRSRKLGALGFGMGPHTVASRIRGGRLGIGFRDLRRGLSPDKAWKTSILPSWLQGTSFKTSKKRQSARQHSDVRVARYSIYGSERSYTLEHPRPPVMNRDFYPFNVAAECCLAFLRDRKYLTWGTLMC